MTVCLIGNSHLICIRDALDARAPGVADDYLFYPFVVGGPAVENGVLIPQGESERERDILDRALRDRKGYTAARLRLADQDAVVIVSMGLALPRVAPLFERYRVWSPGEDVDRSAPFLSRDCFVDTAVGLLKRTVSLRLVAQIRACSATPVYVIPSPAPAAALRHCEPTGGLAKRVKERFRRAWTHLPSESTLVQSVWLDALVRACDGVGATPLPQRPSTFDGAFTHARYQVEEGDPIHTNTSYGEILLEQITDAIGGSDRRVPGGRPGARPRSH